MSADERTTRPLPTDERRAELVFALAVGAGLALVALLYHLFSTITALLLLSSLVAYAVLPIVDRIARALPRPLAVLAVALGGVGVGVGLVLALAPFVAAELSRLPETLATTGDWLRGTWEQLHGRLPRFVARFVDGLLTSTSQALRRAGPAPDRLTSWAAGAAAGVSAVASGLIFVPLFVLLMLQRYHAFVARLSALVPPRWRPRFYARVHEADQALSWFVRGQLLVALLLALVYGVSFSLVGLPLGLVIGILAGLGELVPFLGSIIALVFGSIMALAGGEPTDALWVAGIYLVVQAVQGAVLSPLIVGHAARIRPVALIVALAIGGELFGFLGLLFAVPAAGVLKVAARVAATAFRESTFYRARAPS